jgi:hypothetical protein
MRMRRTFTYAAVWAALTVLAAVVVWWGLGPLLTPIMQSAASPPQSPSPTRVPSLAVSPVPVVSMPPRTTATPTTTPGIPLSPSPSAVRPQPSMFEGWSYANGVFTQAFTLDGGRATVRIAGGRVELVSSQAATGYTATPRQPSPDRLVVDFFNGTHFFVLDAMWWEGKPYAKVTQVS